MLVSGEHCPVFDALISEQYCCVVMVLCEGGKLVETFVVVAVVVGGAVRRREGRTKIWAKCLYVAGWAVSERGVAAPHCKLEPWGYL